MFGETQKPWVDYTDIHDYYDLYEVRYWSISLIRVHTSFWMRNNRLIYDIRLGFATESDHDTERNPG